MPTLPNNPPVGNNPDRALDQAREYLAALEHVAHAGRTSPDRREVLASLLFFARPTPVLKRLLERSRKGA